MSWNNLISSPVAKWVVGAIAIFLLVLAFRVKDIRYKDWFAEFDRQPSASAVTPPSPASMQPGVSIGRLP